MAVTLTVNGTGYSFPNTADENWGDNVTNWATAVTSGMLQKAGGTFTLTAEVDFGATYGLKSTYFKSRAANPASAGQMRLGNTEVISWRNSANSADLSLTVNASNLLQFNGTSFLFAGAGSLVDADISPSAAISYSKLNLTNSIVNADISASAAIAYSKLAALTASRVLVSDGSGVVSASSVTTTTLGYLDATSSIQTQLDAKASSASLASHEADTTSIHGIADTSVLTTNANTQTFTNKTFDAEGTGNSLSNISNTNIKAAAGIAHNKMAALTASRAMVTDGSGFASASSVTATELGYLSGVTGAIQTQIDSALTNPMNASGDMIYGGASGTPTRLAKGSDGQMLTLASGVPAWTSAVESFGIINLGLSCSVGSNALTIALKQSDGSSDASASSPVKIGFRSSTLTSGAFNQRSITGSLSLTVSSGSTLGTLSARAHNLWVYAIDNAGTVELAISQSLYHENQVISTTAEGGAGAADSNSTVYSTTARSNVPFRLIGKLVSTQTTAGTWAAVPTTVTVGHYGSLSSGYVIRARYTGDGSGSLNITTAGTKLLYATRVEDTHGAMSSSVFTAPQTKTYAVCGYNQVTSAGSSDLVNGTIVLVCSDTAKNQTIANGMPSTGNSTTTGSFSFSTTIFLLAGETIQLQNAFSTGGTLNQDRTGARAWINIFSIGD